MLWHGLSQRRLCRSPGRFSSRVKRAHRLWTRRHRHYTCPFLHSSHSTCQLHLVRRCEECRNLPIRSTKPNPHADRNHNHSCNTPSPFLYFVVLTVIHAPTKTFCRRFLSLLVGCLSLAAMILVGNVGRHLCNFIPEATFQQARRVVRHIVLHSFMLHYCGSLCQTNCACICYQQAVVLFHLKKCVGSCFTQDPDCHDDQALAACSLPQTWDTWEGCLA